MKFLRSIWSILTNLVAVLVFLGMLSVAASQFETIVVSGIALIYTAVTNYGAFNLRATLSGFNATSNQFIYLAKLYNQPEKREEIAEMEADLKSDWEEFAKKNYIFYINMFFSLVIWVIAIGAIIMAL